MAYFRASGSLANRENAKQVVLPTFRDIFDRNAGDFFNYSISVQRSKEFVVGRTVGSLDYGDWVKSGGQKAPLALYEHFSKL